MRLIYSIGCPFNYSGLGKTAYYQIKSIQDLFDELIVYAPSYEKGDLANIKLDSFPINPIIGKLHARISNYYIKDLIFDNWVKNKIKRDKFEVFWSWSNHCLNTLIKIKEKSNRVIILLERQSLEIRSQRIVLEEEYKRLGYGFNLISNRILKRALLEQSMADFIIVPSNLVAESFYKAEFSNSRIKLNPVGIDINRFSPKKIYEDGIFRVIYVGLVTIRKGIHRLIDVWEKLNLRNSELLIVGTFYPREKRFFRKKFRECPNLVHVNGTSNPEKYYKNSSVFVLPSIEDGFGSVVLEAMASGLPVIVSNMVGAKDCIDIGYNGFVYNYLDNDEMAEMIYFFYKNPDKILKFGERSSELVKKYSWENFIHRTKLMLGEIIGS
jgi:glycosyltransferase involved in cell wall biosynthesis